MSDLLIRIFTQACLELSHRPPPPLVVEFYPYADIKHTIRRRQGRFLIRLSDAFADAPPEVLRSLAFLLLGKILRRPIPGEYPIIYRRYVNSPGLAADIAHLRAARARHTPDSGPGRHFQLVEIMGTLNEHYFQNRLKGIRIVWTQNRSPQRLGYYRESVHTIAISRALDKSNIPRYVVEYVVYHEMLHADLPSKTEGARRRVHTAEFKCRERLFEKAKPAEVYLRKGLHYKIM